MFETQVPGANTGQDLTRHVFQKMLCKAICDVCTMQEQAECDAGCALGPLVAKPDFKGTVQTYDMHIFTGIVHPKKVSAVGPGQELSYGRKYACIGQLH